MSMQQTRPAIVDVGLGAVVTGGRVGMACGRVMVWPARVALRAPILGPRAERVAGALARDGQNAVAESRARVTLFLREADLDWLADAILDDPRTERLLIRVLESRLLDHVTERVLSGPEFQRVLERIATSPEIRETVARQSETLAGEVVADVRTRSEGADESIERHVRGWLRRPRPAM
jgi:hypothetical protein